MNLWDRIINVFIPEPALRRYDPEQELFVPVTQEWIDDLPASVFHEPVQKDRTNG